MSPVPKRHCATNSFFSQHAILLDEESKAEIQPADTNLEFLSYVRSKVEDIATDPLDFWKVCSNLFNLF
jgi:hypothetical protein